MVNTAKTVLELRKALRETQEKFSKRLGTTQPMVTRWETSQRPTDEWLVKLVEVAKNAGFDDIAAELVGEIERKRLKPKIEVTNEDESEVVNAVLRVLRNPRAYKTDLQQLRKVVAKAKSDNAEVLSAHQTMADIRSAMIRLHERGQSASEIAEVFGYSEEKVNVVIGFHRYGKMLERSKELAQ